MKISTFKILVLVAFSVLIQFSYGDSLKVLFLGNSHTYSNDLPQLTADLALSNGDTIIFSVNAPGGYTLGHPQNGHLYNETSLELINYKNWDFVILQEQSVFAAIDYYRENYTYPGAFGLDSLIKINNECTETIIQLIWAKRDGGQHCINEYCTIDFTDFSHMQDSLTSKYKQLADSLSLTIAPTGATWQELILSGFEADLFASDGNHPSLAGSYATSCVYYSTLFQKSPIGLSYTAGLNPEDALTIQEAADEIVFGNPTIWNLNGNAAIAGFEYSQNENTIYCTDNSVNAENFFWDFGDGMNSTEPNPIHTYETNGMYILSQEASNLCNTTIAFDTVYVNLSNQQEIKNEWDIILCNGDKSGSYILRTLNSEVQKIKIFDITGIIRFSDDNIKQKEYKMELSHLPRGVYILVAVTNNERKIIKFSH